MYEVTTAIKTIATEIGTRFVAEMIAKEAFKTHNYVEVKEIVSTSPWYAKSVVIFKR